MDVEIGTEAVQFPEKEYINGSFLAVRTIQYLCTVGRNLMTLCKGKRKHLRTST
jgi:hypothetical protein